MRRFIDLSNNSGGGGPITADARGWVNPAVASQSDPSIPNSLAAVEGDPEVCLISINAPITLDADMVLTKKVCFAQGAYIDTNGFNLIFQGEVISPPQFIFPNPTKPELHGNETVYMDWFADLLNPNAVYVMNLVIRYKLFPNGRLVLKAGSEMYLGNRLTIPKDNIIVDGVDFVAIPDMNDATGNNWTHGGVRVRGEIVFDPQPLLLGAPANAGDTQIILSSSTAPFTTPKFSRIRGENGADGIALWYEDIHIISYDPATRVATLAKPLQYSYQISYPGSAWPGISGTDWTLINHKEATLITNRISAGDTDIKVADSSIFQKGDAIVIESDVYMDQFYQYLPGRSNPLPIYAFHTYVEEVIDANTIRIAHQAPNNFLIDENDPPDITGLTAPSLRVVKLNLVKNSHIRDCSLRYVANNEKLTDHAFQLVLAEHCTISNSSVDGSGGQKGHGFSIREAIGCTVSNCSVKNPLYGDSGEGYGFSLYSCTDSTMKNVRAYGCRHAVLFFRNACYNIVDGIYAYDTAISAIDFHGGNSNHNVVKNGVIREGVKACNDLGFTTIYDTNNVYNKSAIKFGNNKHVHGDFNNVVENVVCKGYKNKYAFQMFLNQEYNTFTNIWYDPVTDQVSKGDPGTGTAYPLNIPISAGVEVNQNCDNNIVRNCTFWAFMVDVNLQATVYLVDPLPHGLTIVENCEFDFNYGFFVYVTIDSSFALDVLYSKMTQMYQMAYINTSNTTLKCHYRFMGNSVHTYTFYPTVWLVRAYSNLDVWLTNNYIPEHRLVRWTTANPVTITYGGNVLGNTSAPQVANTSTGAITQINNVF